MPDHEAATAGGVVAERDAAAGVGAAVPGDGDPDLRPATPYLVGGPEAELLEGAGRLASITTSARRTSARKRPRLRCSGGRARRSACDR